MRTLSLADAGELSLNRQPVQVVDLLRRVAAAYRHRAEQHGIALIVRADDDLPPIQADPDRLAQVLGNLVGNALHYTPERGQIRLAARRQAGELHLEVADTGRGIPPADLPHIFDRFYRGEESRQQSGGESGLGLAIAKAIVEAHGGRISVRSAVGQGTSFTLVFEIQGQHLSNNDYLISERSAAK